MINGSRKKERERYIATGQMQCQRGNVRLSQIHVNKRLVVKLQRRPKCIFIAWVRCVARRLLRQLVHLSPYLPRIALSAAVSGKHDCCT